MQRGVPDINVFAIDVSFDAIVDPKERTYFMNQPTSFVLSSEAVDRLRAVAGELLRQSADYQRLLKDLGAPGGN